MKTKQASERGLSVAALRMHGTLSDVRFAAAALVLMLASNLFATWFVSQERFVYFWDFRIYWLKYANALGLFRTSLWHFASNLYWSLRGADYNDMAAYGLVPFGLIFGTSRLSYILAIVNVYAIPAIVLFYFVWHGFARPSAEEVPRSLWLYVATVIFLAPLWNPLLWGYVDIGGLIPISVALLVYLARPPHRYRVLDILVLGFSLAIAVLFRRWYAFWSVTFYLALGLDLVLSAASGRIDRKDFGRGVAKVAAAGVLSVLVLLALAYPITIYMLRTDYADLYSYMRKHDSYVSAIFAAARRLGMFECVLFFASAIYCLSRQVTRRITAILLFQTVAIILFFLRIQDFDAQHLYLLQPVMILCIMTFITDAAGRIASPVGRKSFITAYALVIAFCFASVFVPQVKAMVPSLQPVLPFGHLPLRRDDLAEIDRMVKTVGAEFRTPEDHLYVLADSETLNFDTLAFAPMSLGQDSPIRERIYSTSSIDKRDGFPAELLEATHVMVGVPIQLIADECQQRFVSVPARQILEGRGIGRRFTRLDYEFQLTGGVRAYLFRKIGPIGESDRANLSDELRQPCVP